MHAVYSFSETRRILYTTVTDAGQSRARIDEYRGQGWGCHLVDRGVHRVGQAGVDLLRFPKMAVAVSTWQREEILQKKQNISYTDTQRRFQSSHHYFPIVFVAWLIDWLATDFNFHCRLKRNALKNLYYMSSYEKLPLDITYHSVRYSRLGNSSTATYEKLPIPQAPDEENRNIQLPA